MAILENYKLSELSYFKTGGFCKTLYQPESKKELGEALRKISRDKTPYFFLGLGSNSLVSDRDWKGAVINLNKMKRLEKKQEGLLLAEAGVENSTFAEFALSHMLGGASWMYGLPGCLGATARMNARCYGGEISEIVTKITSFTSNGIEKVYQSQKGQKDVFRAYKDTIFMDNKELIAELEISLSPSDSASIKEKMISCFEDRKSKGQYLHPSCGCVFKNDYRKEVSVPSGLLIDFCGLKGKTLGGARISPNHANFTLNENKASSSDILKLSFLVRETVWEKLGVWLEYEMETLGHFSAEDSKRLLEKREENFNHEALQKLRDQFQKKF